MNFTEINKRYSELATSDCCLSCGSAINFANAAVGEVCVDLGSGRGTDAIRLAEAVGPLGFVYGIDISDGMIEKANIIAEKLSVKNIKFLKSPLEKLDIPDDSVDFVISNCTINHAENKQAVWNEIFRILKKGGRFVVSDIYAVNLVDEKYKNDLVAVAECWAGAITRKEYLNQIASSGFADININEESAPYKKGEALVASITLSGLKPGMKCCCCEQN
jgi:ubiquinone/menaquinone biosynthesis C-methylase UbiE